MPFQKFFIAPLNEGLVNNVRPWLIADQAFSRMQNAYNFRGLIRKRVGSIYINTSVPIAERQQYTRLKINLGNTPGPFNIPGTTLGVGISLAVGQMFSIGADNFTVWQTGAGVTTLTTNLAITCTINSVAVPQTVTFAGAVPAATPVFWYPSRPVMGIKVFEEDAVNQDVSVAFDQNFAYTYSTVAANRGWIRLRGTGPEAQATWSGNADDFFWTCTWRGDQSYQNIFFTTNYTFIDQITYWNGTAWTRYAPQTITSSIILPGPPPSPNLLITARILVPFKDRLVSLNTIESEWDGAAFQNRTHVNRARFSQNGDPTSVVNGFSESPGRGGFIDAPTKESIISAEFVRDRLIVYFERSTWELVYTGNELFPFRWQQINTELGAESTFSIVPFDKIAMGIGASGIHVCNGANVERIDQKIPQEVFDIHNADFGLSRVHGIRDFFTELVYWTIPYQNQETNPFWANRILVYNYATQSWSFFDDSITTFGYFFAPFDSEPLYQQNQRLVLAGNLEGYTFIMHPDVPVNASVQQITNIVIAAGNITFTIVDHNMVVGEFIQIINASGMTNLSGNIYMITGFGVFPNDEVVVTNTTGAAGTYIGNGTASRVSRLDILTKEFNFFVNEGRNAYINKVDFMLDRTSSSAAGQFTVDFYDSTSTLPMLTEATTSGSILGTGIVNTTANALYPLEATQTRLWHPTYLQAEGEVIQMRFYWNNAQMLNPNISLEDLQLHAFTIYAQPTSRLQ